MKIWKRISIFLFCFGISPFCLSLPVLALDLPEGDVVTELFFIQEGEGTPSLNNIRNIVGCNTAELSFSNDEGDIIYSMPLQQLVYGGSYDWAKGELTITHKMFELAVKDMNRNNKFPGWGGVEGFAACFPSGYNAPAASNRYITNISSSTGSLTIGINYDFSILTLYPSYFGLDQDQWKSQYPDLICQFVFPLLEPEVISVPLCTEHSWTVSEYMDSTCVIHGRSVQTCSACGLIKTVSLPLMEHTWEETTRTDAAFDSLGSVTYTCSTCGKTKTETLSLLPGPTESMGTLLSVITDVFSLFVGWISAITAVFVSNPVLLVVVVFCFISIGIFLYKRILRL